MDFNREKDNRGMCIWKKIEQTHIPDRPLPRQQPGEANASRISISIMPRKIGKQPENQSRSPSGMGMKVMGTSFILGQIARANTAQESYSGEHLPWHRTNELPSNLFTDAPFSVFSDVYNQWVVGVELGRTQRDSNIPFVKPC